MDSRSDQPKAGEDSDNDVIVPPPALYDPRIDDVMYEAPSYGSNGVSLYAGNDGDDDVMYDENYDDDEDVIESVAYLLFGCVVQKNKQKV